jgi:tetratricopeptide (TPR) repeat protein
MAGLEGFLADALLHSTSSGMADALTRWVTARARNRTTAVTTVVDAVSDAPSSPAWRTAMAACLQQLAEQATVAAVAADRADGASWADVSESLGISRSAAHSRLGPQTDQLAEQVRTKAGTGDQDPTSADFDAAADEAWAQVETLASQQRRQALARAIAANPELLEAVLTHIEPSAVWAEHRTRNAWLHGSPAAGRPAAVDPDNGPPAARLATALRRLSALARETGNLEEACEHARRAAELHAELSGEAPGNRFYRAALAADLACMGELAHENGRSEEALTYLKRAVELQQQLAAGAPDNDGSSPAPPYFATTVGLASGGARTSDRAENMFSKDTTT